MNLQTNIIRNVYNIGTNSCDAGTQYCSDGYSLYFPCLKDVTRGENVCFDFYITDNTTKDVVDLRTVSDPNNPESEDVLTLELGGQYGCTYGLFSYPDNISSLQTEEFIPVYVNDFEKKGACHLSLASIDVEELDLDKYINFKEGDFYTNDVVEVEAKDTPTHIFIGWMTMENDDDECTEETLDDYIICTNNVYQFIIKNDIRLFALYRPRKSYTLIVDKDNKNSHYNVTYKGVVNHISNRPDEIFDDENDGISVLEGYHFIAECIPNIVSLDSDSDSDDDYAYRFAEWKDGISDSRYRTFIVGVDTNKFESGDTIKLFAYCYGPVNIYTPDEEVIEPILDLFDDEGIHILTGNVDSPEYEYSGDATIYDVDNVTLKYINDLNNGLDGFLHFNNSSITLSSGITDGIMIDIAAIAENPGELQVTVNGITMSQTVGYPDDEDTIKHFYFSKCDNSPIVIRCCDECLIGEIKVLKEEIIDKGKAQLCLDSETTSSIPTGPLSVSGAIMVDGHMSGLAKTQIGTVNKLKKITIN